MLWERRRRARKVGAAADYSGAFGGGIGTSAGRELSYRLVSRLETARWDRVGLAGDDGDDGSTTAAWVYCGLWTSAKVVVGVCSSNYLLRY